VSDVGDVSIPNGGCARIASRVGFPRTGHGDLVDEPEETLRRLSLHDERALSRVLGAYAQGSVPGLDAKGSALARLAATIALRGELPSYLSNVDAAIDGGADLDEVIGVFLAIAPEIGEAAASKAAIELEAVLANYRPPVA
jgi:alkylhydroperoxidase/carboxymuconolactone decarboxylase family protein YurZ